MSMSPEIDDKILKFVEDLNALVLDFVNQQDEELTLLFETHYKKPAAQNKLPAISKALSLLQGARAQYLAQSQSSKRSIKPVKRDVKWAASGAVKAAKALTRPETEESKARLEVCKGCDQWTGKSCKMCGCFVKLKVRIPEEKCPIGKW
jgi:hypothetical protein